MNEDMLRPSGGRTVPNSRLTCSQCERMILDAIDGTLLPEDQLQFDLHIAGCAPCSRAMEEAQKGAAWLSMLKEAPPVPSADLLERILTKTSGDPEIAIPLLRPDTILGARQAYPAGHSAQLLPFRVPASRSWPVRAVHAVMQPRFAMTAAMAFFSIALTMNLTGVQLRDLRASSLKPSNLRHGFWSMNSRVFRYYDNLRIVYELESRVRELQRQDDDHPAEPSKPVTAPPAESKPPDAGKDPRAAEPKSSNPAKRGSALQSVIGRSHGPVTLALQECSPAASATGKCGEGVRRWTV